MNNKIIDITFWQLASAYVFIILLLIIVRWRRIPREKEILISSIRMTLQLILVGFILTYVFKHANPYYTVIIFLIMETFAIYNTFQRVKKAINPQLKKAIAISMAAGTFVTLIYFNFVVLHFSPWYNPRYFIPIGGMIIGNSMTGITLGVSALIEGMKSKKDLVESALMLGAAPYQATKDIVNHAFDSAVLPTINSMVGMGIVFLPGMMTGVILSGASPFSAIKYQIAIMLGISGSVSLTVILFLYLGYKAFFNKRSQLVD
ncbi:putative ABC transport system permease protein [Scopulibacillus darangshiensis]|uniref:Putative ABC transport system permease protein n=1 Tax=Scopulibacillus darangshiensis TaxID=442528 RepID=A0A4R2NP47_9BACL|nr:iron export ABC transporter permease subunit FetB [Scopulibacillus darangshiensis]TCP23412.1 putative ABC transport system permease protein [Scopulibacillus darangshiensis]